MRGKKTAGRIAFAAALLCVLAALAGGGLKGRLTPFISAAPPRASVRMTARNSGEKNVVLDVETPAVTGFADAAFEDALNAAIASQIGGAVAGALDAAKSDAGFVFVLRVSAEVKHARGILSLRVTDDLDNGGTGFPHTVYYNADIQKSRLLSLDDLFVSREYRAAIDQMIRRRVRSDAHYFADSFTGVDAATSFFIADGRLFIAFAKYEIASGMTGEPVFEVPALLIRRWLKPEYAPLLW